MAQDLDVSVARRSFRAEIAQRMFRMGRVASQCLVDLFHGSVSQAAQYRRPGSYLLVHNHINLHPRLGTAFQHLVQSPFLGQERRPPQKQLGRQPPVFDVDDLLGLLESDGDGPQVVQCVDIPLDAIVLPDGGEGLESMGFGDRGSLPVGFLLVLLVVAVVGVDDVEELAYFVLEMVGLFLDVGFCMKAIVGQLSVYSVKKSRVCRPPGAWTFEVLLEGRELVPELVHCGGQLMRDRKKKRRERG